MLQRIFPIITWSSEYKRTYFSQDLFSGITVGIMLIPQGMAYAMIAGLPPVYGLYASIIPQIIYAILGTSRQLSVAPVAMDSLLVAAGVSVLATEGSNAYITFAILLAFFMGAFQLLLGIFRMGFITNLLAKPVISGFTSAAALIIGLNQLKHLLGIELAKSNRIYEIVWNAIQAIDHTHFATLGIGILGIVIIKGVKKIHQSIPGALIAVVMGILIVYGFQLHEAGVAIVKTIPRGLPPFQWPNLSVDKISELIPLALTIAVVAFMEAYSVAKAIEAKQSAYKVSANQELVALGAANVVGSLFQSYPVTGGFSRTAVNQQAGAKTPLASIFSALFVGLTLLFLTPLFYYLPKAILASVIMVAVYSLIDFGYAKKLWKENKIEFSLLLVTFLITLSFSMVIGIVSGIVISILILLYRSAYPHIALLGQLKGHNEFRNVNRFRDLEVWDNMLIMRIDASITFINIQYVKDYIEQALAKSNQVKTIVIDAGPISQIDASAVQGLTDLLTSLTKKGITLKMSEVIGPVRDTLHKTGLLPIIGEENIYLTLHDAVKSGLDGATYKMREVALQHGELSKN